MADPRSPCLPVLLGALLGAGLGAGLALPAQAGSKAGVCPDGSAFVVQRLADVPCSNAKLLETSDVPPMRPELLPKPYTWYVDQETRDETNPYNLVDPAQRIRAIRAGQALSDAPEPAPALDARGAPEPSFDAAPLFGEQDLGDLVKYIALRQRLAPATLTVKDVQGREELRLRFAHSDAFEDRVLRRMGSDASRHHVLAFYARALRTVDFHPNFLVVQDGGTFRPDPAAPSESGFLVGDPGRLEGGLLVLGYLVVPGRFDPSRPYEIYWNDRSITATLRP